MSNKTRIFRRTLKFCGSTLLGAALMTASALAMGWATFVEREMGTPVAQRVIYASNWFYVLIGALGFNVLCSALVRLPAFIRRVPVDANPADAATSAANTPTPQTKIVVERRLVPFYLAHLGILVLLAGCLATALFGTQARMTIPEGTAAEKALDPNARLFDVALVDLTSPADAEPTKLEIPFSGGPLNWRDCASYKSWQDNVSAPLLAKMGEGSFFKDLAKSAAKWSQKAAFVAANVSRTQKPGTLYERDGFKIEILDYATIYDFAPVEPLAATLTLKKPDGKTVVEKVELAFPNDATPPTDALSSSRRAVRQTLTDGVRIVYMLADSNAEAAAFLKTVPTKTDSNAEKTTETDATESVATPNVNKNDVVVLSVDGERFQLRLTDLAPLAYSGSSDEQRASLETQRTEIECRLDLERKREDATPDNAAELKPLQTVKREDLERNAAELSDLLRSTNELLAASADQEKNGDAENPALVEARQKYSQRRILNYLASAWAQLESASATSQEFCEALEKMLSDTKSRLTELDRLDAASRLGETGWRIVGFETSPTLVSNVDELQGWTALIQLESPQGDKCEATLFSELAERNRYPENGRVFGALWLDRFEGSDSEYGRPWNPAISKPKLELAQTPDGALYYRYNNGLNEFQTGKLETKTLDAALQTVAVAETALTDVAKPTELTAPTSFSLAQVELQTELGYRFTPGAFTQEKANEFYGTAKVRVALDEAVETFWLRTIPLESVSDEQLKYLTKRVVSSKRAATIRLTDRELDLGVALFVKKFTPVYEPGSTTAASFSSLVRVLPQGLSAEEQAAELAQNPENDALIQMNRPGVLRSPDSGRVFWAYQDSFNGPFRPGDPEFERVVDGRLLPGETSPRETLYSTTITLNDDPGRGLKYLGSLLIVLGTAFLIYRKSPKSATMPESNATDSNKTTSGVKTLASTLVFTLATLFASATFAQESDKTQPVKTQEVATSSSAVSSDAAKNFAQTNSALDWKTWRLLPVFADGRRQPLNTFAEILVRDVCGTATPVFAVPAETLARLESGKPLNFPTLDEVLKEVAPDKRAERTAAFNEISAGVVERQREIAAKLRATFPNGTRRFEAPELLFSWIVEPEIWDYVPFVADAQAEVSQGVFSRTPSEIASRFSRLAPEDFERLDEKSGRTVVENFRATSGQNAPPIMKALGEAERRLTLFRSVSFVPTQSPSTRPSRYLQRILYGAPSSVSPHSGMSPSASPLAKLDAATRNLERLISTTDKDLRSKSPFSNGDFLLRQTEKFSQNGREVEALKLAKAFYLLEMQNVATPTPANGERFETLTVAVGDALSELREHRDAIFADETFSDEYRRELLKCVDALSEIADLLELAYLSTPSELPKTLDVVPVVRRREFRLSESQESPWVPLQTLLWAPDSLLARFVDPSLAPELQRLAQTPTPVSSTPRRKRETPPTLDEQTISPFATFDEALHKTIDLSVYERPAAEAFLEAAAAYRDVAAPNRAERFNAALDRFAAELRSLAERSEPFRVALASEEVADERLRTSFLAKTAYPTPDALDAEFLYNRLNPFYWNWVACLLAVVALLVSYCRQTFVRLRQVATSRGETVSSQAFTPFEERFFFVVGFVFLALSCAVAFLGGAIRAYITGWAPVTNMFETVVLLAFLIAAIAIGYALFPAWGCPFANAWRVSAFPGRLRDATSEELRVSRLLRWPRVVTIVLCVVAALRVCYREEMFVSGDSLARVVLESFAMQGILDRCAILGTFFFIAWSVPRFLAAVAALVVFPKTTLRRDDLLGELRDKLQDTDVERRAAIKRLIATQIVQRKAFLTASSVIALLVAAAAYFNSSEFNPNIRPLAAVLRSNFWLTIHVFAIIVSYALGAIAWVVALTSLTSYIFGRYNADAVSASALTPSALSAVKRREKRRAKKNADANRSVSATSNANVDWEPAYSRRVSGIIATMIRSSVLFLTIGIILGARWADFSWGRFWSWDPKEVWALVTLLIYLVVLHVLKVKRCGNFGLAVGATLGALAIVMTWYGLSFVMGGGGRHSYAAGESNKVAVLYLLFAANLLWTLVATARYQIAKSGRKPRDGKR